MNPIFAYLTLCAFLGVPAFGVWRLWLYLKKVKKSDDIEQEIDNFDVFANAHNLTEDLPAIEENFEEDKVKEIDDTKIIITTKPKPKVLPPPQKKSLPLPATKKSLPSARKRNTS